MTRKPPPAQPLAPGRGYAGAAIVGERKNQEDYARFAMQDDGTLLAVLADGMGGHAAGEVASQEAVEAFCAAFGRPAAMSVGARLSAALEAANAAIGRRVVAEPDLDGMGCTLVAVHLGDDGLRWVSVGDSPLYLMHGGRLAQINQDHSMGALIEESVRSGKLSRAEADQHPSRNVLRSALLGDEPPDLVDLREDPLPLAAGDLVIVASDGLQTLTGPAIERVLMPMIAMPADQCATALLEAVERERAPRQDNTTVQVIHAQPSTRRPARSRPAAAPLGRGALRYTGLVLVCAVLAGLLAGVLWHVAAAPRQPVAHKAAPPITQRWWSALPGWTHPDPRPDTGFESAEGKADTPAPKRGHVAPPAPDGGDTGGQ
jgi:protein phosphatase